MIHEELRLLALLLLALAPILAACGTEEAEPATTQEPLRVLALGDSYTIGEGVEETARWPNLLAETLREEGYAVVPPSIVATTGWTTDELAAALDEADSTGAATVGTLEPPYDLVTLLVGVNNQYRGVDRGYTVERYRQEFAALLSRAVYYAGGDVQRVVVVGFPDWGVTPFAEERYASGEEERDADMIALQVDAHNAAAQRIAKARGVRYVDVAETSRAMPSAVAEDGLHPDSTQYAAWTASIAPVVLEHLRARDSTRAAL
jgi:lysophospholipase L1-like esterase